MTDWVALLIAVAAAAMATGLWLGLWLARPAGWGGARRGGHGLQLHTPGAVPQRGARHLRVVR